MQRLYAEIPGTWAGAAGPRTPAETQSRWRTNSKNMRNIQVETVLDMVQRVFFTRCTNKGMPCGMYERRKQQMYVETVTGYMNDRSPDFSRARRPESRLTLAPTTTSLPLKRNGVGRSPAPHQQRNMCRGRRPPHPRRSLIGVQMARTCGRFRSKWY